MIVNKEGKFNKDVLAMGNNFIIKYEQLMETYNERQYTMVLIKNLATIKFFFFLKTQYYKKNSKVMGKGIQGHFL
jgi:hypothetical protein